MSKVEVRMFNDFNCFEVSYGKELAIRIRNNRKAIALAVDVGRDSTNLCFITHGSGSNDSLIESIKGGKFEDIANFVKAILSVAKPEKLYLDSIAYGMALWDYILPYLVENNIYVSKDGTVSYNLSREEFVTKVNNEGNRIYERAFKSQ